MSTGIMSSAAGAGRTNTLSAASRPWDTREQQGRESSARGAQGAEDELPFLLFGCFWDFKVQAAKERSQSAEGTFVPDLPDGLGWNRP